MKRLPLMLDSFHFEIRYAYGYLFFDRCGQCMNDIERHCEGWYAKRADTSQGVLECPEKSLSIEFNSGHFVFSSQKSSKIGIESIAQEINNVWKIVEANLGLEEYERQGCRFYYLIGTSSEEESERLIQKAEFKIIMPEHLTMAGFDLKKRQMVAVLSKGACEYRIQLMSAIRYEGMDPDNLIKVDPKLLSEKQNAVRLAKIRQLSEYSADPMYAACLDVDCYQIRPEQVSVQEFILNQTDIVKSAFLPILEKL